jgi:flagellar basal-body rod protein FlgB
MDSGFLDTRDAASLKRMLDLATVRHDYLANNIANVESPDYQPKDIEFFRLLKDARQSGRTEDLSITNVNHIPLDPPGSASAFHVGDNFLGNYTIDASRSQEQEMASLAMNSFTYRAATDLLARKMRIMNTAITGGR